MHRIILQRFASAFSYGMTCLALLCFISFQSVQASSQDNAVPLLQHYQKTHPINQQAVTELANEKIKMLMQQVDTNNIQTPMTLNIHLFPIHSGKLSPGKVLTRKLERINPKPIFIIGFDNQSIAWLKQQHQQLKQFNAKGFVVNVNNQAEFKQLQQIAPQIPLVPLPGNVLANKLQLKHYPVLITNHLIIQ